MRKYAVLALIVILALMMSGCAPFSPAPPTKAILEGRVLVPEGAVRQVGGQPLPGATVRVKDLEGNIVATTTTDANGYYRVEVPAGGPYIVEVVKGSIKVLRVSPQVEAGKTYDLKTADATSTAVALVFQAKVEAGEDPAEIDLEELAEDPKIKEELAQAIEEALAAGKDPTTAPEVTHLVDVIVTPPAPPAPKPTPEPVPTYNITIASVVGGTATVTTDPADAEAAGTTVTVNISNIQEGKQFHSIAVTDADGNPVTTTEKTPGSQYTFTMPTKAVTITVTLEDIPVPTYTVTFNVTPTNATVEVKDSKGNVVATTTPGVYKLTPGAYTYTVSKEGYVTQTGSFPVTNQDLTITVNLEAVAKVCGLTVKMEGTNIVVVEFEVDKELNLSPITGEDDIPLDNVGKIEKMYKDLETAISTGGEEAIREAALAIGDDIVIEYYYENGAKEYLKTANNNDLIKNKYWQGYLNVLGGPEYVPDWREGGNTTIPANKTISTWTNPTTGTVSDNWLDGVRGKKICVKVTVIHKGGVHSEIGEVEVPTLDS